MTSKSAVFSNAACSLRHCPDHDPGQPGNVHSQIDQLKIPQTGAMEGKVGSANQMFDFVVFVMFVSYFFVICFSQDYFAPTHVILSLGS